MSEILTHPDLTICDDVAKIEKKLNNLMEKTLENTRKAPQLLEKSATQDLTHGDFNTFIKKGECDLTTKSLSSDKQQGITLPQVMMQTLNDTLEKRCPMRQICQVTAIEAERLDVLVDSKAAQAGWATETSPRDETDAATLKTISIHAHHMYAKPRISQQLLEDNIIDLEGWMLAKIASQFAATENFAFINGNGKNKPRGFLAHDTATSGDFNDQQKLQVITSGEDGVIDSTDVLIDTVNAMKTELLEGSVWLMSRSALSQIKRLKDNDDRFIWQPSLSEQTPHTLLGFPVILSDDMPQANAGDVSKAIAFGNFKVGYQIVDRADMNILRDPFSAKPYIEFYTTKRVGGDVVNFDAIKVISLEQHGA